MKKITYLSALALGLALVSCDGYKEPNPPAQYNPQAPILMDGDVSSEAVLDPSTTYNLEAMTADEQNITLATATVKDLAEGYSLGAVAYLSNDNFETQFEVPVSGVKTDLSEEGYQNYNLVMSPRSLSTGYEQNVTLNPAEATLSIRVVLTAIMGSEVAYIGGPDNYAVDSKITFLPIPSGLVIEDAYYLVGTIDDWKVENSGAYQFSHSDQDVWDDPVFSIIINITEAQAAAGWWWKVIPQSTYEAGNFTGEDYSQWGTEKNGETAANGRLVPMLNGEEPGAGDFEEAGPWMLTINLLEGTYEFTKAYPQLYVPGTASNWFDGPGIPQELTTEDYVTYTGYAYISSEFKFTSEANWDATNFGPGEEEGTMVINGAGNMTVETPGLYWCSVNVIDLTYTVTYVPAVQFMGAFNDWSEGINLTSTDYLVWTGTLTLTADANQWKFRMTSDWKVNLGAAGDEEPFELTPGVPYDDMVNGGKNFSLPAGTYNVTLDLSEVPYTVTAVAK